MTKYLKIVTIFALLLSFSTLITNQSVETRSSRVLTVFLDGLRWDYLTDALFYKNNTFHNGIQISNIRPVFPSDCHSNIHAIYAGQAQPNRNFFNKNFIPNYANPKLIWNAAALQGKKTDLYHFPFCADSELIGSGSKFLKCLPPSSETKSLKYTLAEVMSKFEDKQVDFANVYYGELDRLAHSFGPSSEEIKSHLSTEVDSAITDTLKLLQKPSLADVHLLIVADHGMTEFKSFLLLDRLFKSSQVQSVMNYGSMVAIWPTPTSKTQLLRQLRKTKHFRVYTNLDLPIDWLIHLDTAPPILLIADIGYIFKSSFYPLITADHTAASIILNDTNWLRGWHGYPPEFEDMHTKLFIFGPIVKSKFEFFSAPNISTHHVHQLLLHLLNLEPSPLDFYDKSLIEHLPMPSKTKENRWSIMDGGPMKLDSFRFISSMAICFVILMLAVAGAIFCFILRHRNDVYNNNTGFRKEKLIEEEDCETYDEYKICI